MSTNDVILVVVGGSGGNGGVEATCCRTTSNKSPRAKGKARVRPMVQRRVAVVSSTKYRSGHKTSMARERGVVVVEEVVLGNCCW